jgi:hypothetical protein
MTTPPLMLEMILHVLHVVEYHIINILELSAAVLSIPIASQSRCYMDVAECQHHGTPLLIQVYGITVTWPCLAK